MKMKKWSVFRKNHGITIIEAESLETKDSLLGFWREDNNSPYVIFKDWESVWDMEQFDKDKTE